MNATNLDELRNSAGTVTDEKMDQVRDLLFGEYQRKTEAHIGLLEERVRELETSVHRRLDAMQARIDAVAAEVDASQRSSLDEIAKGMQDLSERIRNIQTKW
jgi:polyhydroxyalkanoate synthesis regulator phasin